LQFARFTLQPKHARNARFSNQTNCCYPFLKTEIDYRRSQNDPGSTHSRLHRPHVSTERNRQNPQNTQPLHCASGEKTNIVSSCDREVWPITLTFEPDLDKVTLNQHVRSNKIRWFKCYFPVTQTDRHTSDRLLYTDQKTVIRQAIRPCMPSCMLKRLRQCVSFCVQRKAAFVLPPTE